MPALPRSLKMDWHSPLLLSPNYCHHSASFHLGCSYEDYPSVDLIARLKSCPISIPYQLLQNRHVAVWANKTTGLASKIVNHIFIIWRLLNQLINLHGHALKVYLILIAPPGKSFPMRNFKLTVFQVGHLPALTLQSRLLRAFTINRGTRSNTLEI